jgi:dTDP-4-dehydrorhamnose reductase
MVKIFIFGSNGMLGNYMCSYLSTKYTIVSITRKDYDLSNLEIIKLKIFLKNKEITEGDVVINCAGVIPQANKQREINKQIYYKINSLFPVVLSLVCNDFKAKMIHITTDCVFDGKLGKYNELSIHTETNDYGTSKSLGELCDATIIRTSIIGDEINNKRSLLEWVKSNKNGEINGYVNHYWNGVTCLELAKIILEVIDKKLYWEGVRNIFSPISVSKYELVNIINNVYKLDIKINKFETEIVDKTLISIYEPFIKIKNLEEQIIELYNFKLLKE